MRVLRAKGKDFQASQRTFRGPEVLTLTARNLDNGVQHQRGRDGEFHQQTGQPKEAADGAGYRCSGRVGPLVSHHARFRFRSPDRDTQTLFQSFVDGQLYDLLGGTRKPAQQDLHRHAQLRGELHGKALCFELCHSGLEISVIGRGEVAHDSRVTERS